MTLHHDATPQTQGGVVVGAATLNNGPGEPGVDSPSRGGKETTPPLKYKLVLELTREEVDELYAQALAATREDADSADEAVVDSGASAHFAKNRRWLRKIRKDIIVAVANATGGTSHSKGCGELGIEYLDKNGKVQRLDNIGEAHLVPDLTRALLSVSAMNDSGFSCYFKPEGAWIETPQGEKIRLSRRRGLFFLPNPRNRAQKDGRYALKLACEESTCNHNDYALLETQFKSYG